MAPPTTLALFLSGGFDDDESTANVAVPAALRPIAGGASSLERWLSLSLSLVAPSPPLRVLVVVSPRDDERVRSFLASKALSTSPNVEVVVASEGQELAAAAAAAAEAKATSLAVADASSVPGPWLEFARLRGAASLLSSPSVVVVDVSSLKIAGNEAGEAALAKTCKGLAKVSLVEGSSAVARVASFSVERSALEAQRLAFLPSTSVASAASHRGSVRSWLAARTAALLPSPPSLRALVVAASSLSWPMPHASTAAGRALAAALLRGSAPPAAGAGEWLASLAASSGEDDDVDDVEEGRDETSGATQKQQPKQHSSFSTTSSAYGAPPPPAVAAAIAAAAASSSRRYGPTTTAAPPSPSTTKKLSVSSLPPLSPVLKGAAGAVGMLRFDIPRSRVHDKL